MFLDDSVDAFDRSIHPLGLDMRGHQVRRRGFEHLDATTVLVQRRNLFRQHAEGRPGNQMLIVFQGHQQNLAAFRQHMQQVVHSSAAVPGCQRDQCIPVKRRDDPVQITGGQLKKVTTI